MSRSLIAPFALACSALVGTSAHADVVAFSGFANGSQSVDIALSSPNAALGITAIAGGLLTSLNGGPAFTTYCIDLYEHIEFGQPAYTDYSLVSGAAHVFANNAHANTDIGKLFAEGNVVNDATTQAAFQIAIWEIAYETSGSYNLSNGAARFSGGTALSSGALALASAWLDALPAAVNPGYSVAVLESIGRPGHQDQVFAVPEPSTCALLAAGLLGVGLTTRRRTAQPR